MNLAVRSGAEIALPKPVLAGPTPEFGYTARDVLRTIFFYKRALLLAFLIPTILGVIAAMFASPTYVADAKLLVLPGDEYIYKSAVTRQAQEIVLDRTQVVAGELQILQDDALRKKVLQDLGPDVVLNGHYNPNQPNALEAGANLMATNLTITAVPQSNAINLTYRNGNPNVAADVLNKLIDAYLNQRRAVFQRLPSSQINEQRDALGKRLAAANDKLARFAAAHQITNLDDQLGLLLRQQTELTNNRRDLDQKIDADTAIVAQLQQSLASTPPTISLWSDSGRSVAADARSADFARLQAERREMSRRYRDDSPQVADIDRQLSILGNQIVGAPHSEGAGARSGRNPIYDDLQAQLNRTNAELKGLQASRESLDISAASLDQRLQDMNNAAQPYRDLRRDRDLLEETYQTFSRNAEEAAMSDDLQHSRFANVRVVQSAVPPAAGNSLRRLLALGGILLGIISAIATYTLLMALRQVFIDRADAQRALGLPVLLAVAQRDEPLLKYAGHAGGGMPAPLES
jgi:uncharacterized protein involved in exopolysaccharide biosynthesis